jgi:hypothetical protein
MNAFARGARTGVRIVRMPSERKTSSNAAVNLLSRSWIKKRIGSARSTNVSKMFRACWVAHAPDGFGVTTVNSGSDSIEAAIIAAGDELLGPPEIYRALEEWEQIADLLPDETQASATFVFAAGSNA